MGRAAAGHTRASHGLVPPVSGAEGGVRGRSSRCAGAEHPAGDGSRAGQGAKQDAKHLRGDLPWRFPRGAARSCGAGHSPGGRVFGVAATLLGPCKVPAAPLGVLPRCFPASSPLSPLQPWLGGCDAFGHGPSPGCLPRPRRAEGPQTLSQCSFQPAGCQLPLLPALCLSLLLLQTVGVTRGAPHPTAPLSVVGQTPHFWGSTPHLSHLPGPEPASPLLPATHRNPRGFAGAWAGGSPPSFPPLHPSFFLPVPVCLPEPRSPLSPTLLPVSARGDAISLSDSLQMDVVYTFQTGASSLQGALRRQPSIVSQHHDVKNVSSPTHVALSSVNSTPTTSAVAAAAASPPAGSE